MKRRVADRIAAVSVVLLLLAGLYGAWSAYRRRQAADGTMGSMMDGRMMGGASGVDPIWYGFAIVVAVVVVAGVYLSVRDEVTVPGDRDRSDDSSPVASRSTNEVVDPDSDESSSGRGARPERRPLDLLPEDERRILEPVVASPGITQIELRDRADFSKSKVSQTVSDLEKRGLLFRERQGRTYRVYPDESLHE